MNCRPFAAMSFQKALDRSCGGGISTFNKMAIFVEGRRGPAVPEATAHSKNIHSSAD
jgi:hypothetical protein